jgi:peptidoglycan/xylan/chitin deacetylase (PgdA/CDA1 family)
MNATNTFWPNGARMAISVSMQMEGGAQPASGAESPMPKIDPKYPDLPASKWYDYGFKEGLPRLLEIFERRKIKVTSHMVGAAVDLHPALAKEIVQRGHEAAGHGQTWTAQFSMAPEEERASYQQSIQSIERATGTRPVGFNAFWLRGTPRTLEILQSLGFIYHIDDVSRDEPFLINVRDKPFAVVPYTLHMNDIVNYETRYFSTAMYADDLKAEFDALYAEATILRPQGKDSSLRQWGLHLASRGGKQARNKAVVAVARKLAVLLHRIWITQEPYVPFYAKTA